MMARGFFGHQDFFEHRILVQHVVQVIHAATHAALETFTGGPFDIDSLTAILLDPVQQRLFGTLDLILRQHSPNGCVPLRIELDQIVAQAQSVDGGQRTRQRLFVQSID